MIPADKSVKVLHTLAGGTWACTLRASLALECGRNDLWGQMEEVSQVLDTLIGEGPVIVAPCKLFCHESTRLQGLKHKISISKHWLPVKGEKRSMESFQGMFSEIWV